MSGFNLQKMSNEYYDVLKELGNIGAGNATTALAQMMDTKIDMSVPKVMLLEFYELGDMIGGEEQIMAGISLAVDGDITGSIMFLLKREAAKHLMNQLMPGMGDAESEDFNDMELSALKEVGNIIAGAYLNSLASITNLLIYPSVPDLAIDMAGAILSMPAIQFGAIGDHILLIQTQFVDKELIEGYFILLPDIDSYSRILGSLGIDINTN
ncbi:MAG: chemotaxis protein CheC [Lachnospiraceae bacterium]|jgi:chemotaxis protein CheC|nr:chemotaxis protein CheC [Lachnospiraceae bacterium]